MCHGPDFEEKFCLLCGCLESDCKCEHPQFECGNCQGENANTGYVELWDGVCPECGRRVVPGVPAAVEAMSEDAVHERIAKDHQDAQMWAYCDRVKQVGGN